MIRPNPIQVELVSAVFVCVLFSAGFWLGVEHSRGEVRAAAEEMASRPVNTFTKCLTEGWELSGELSPDWKGERKWVLQ